MDERFEKVIAPVRRQMLSTDRERLPDFAAEWETALRPRFRVLTDELEQIERHRDAIIERLQGMVKHALGGCGPRNVRPGCPPTSATGRAWSSCASRSARRTKR